MKVEEEEEREEKKESFKAVDAERKGKEEDKRDIKMLIDPRRPTKEEFDEHELTIYPIGTGVRYALRLKGKRWIIENRLMSPKDCRNMLLIIVFRETSWDIS